jgi:tRNA A37 methylthiotransferase MiaB
MINNQLWSMVNKLQVELSEYKERLTRLEEEVSSLKKHKVEKSTDENVRTILVGIEQEDAAKGSAKEENKEEMGDNEDDTSSAV